MAEELCDACLPGWVDGGCLVLSALHSPHASSCRLGNQGSSNVGHYNTGELMPVAIRLCGAVFWMPW